MKISICIPTYNRSEYLTNCLQSIAINKNRSKIDFEVCISDNFSTDNTEDVVRAAQKNIPIIYHKHESYIGRVKNYLNVVIGLQLWDFGVFFVINENVGLEFDWEF